MSLGRYGKTHRRFRWRISVPGLMIGTRSLKQLGVVRLQYFIYLIVKSGLQQLVLRVRFNDVTVILHAMKVLIGAGFRRRSAR
jgi:hypothetical protein